MPSYFPPKKNTEFIVYVGLVDQANRPDFKANPTIAAGDFQVSTDGGAMSNLDTLPTVTPAAGRMVKITLSTAEMNGDNVTVVCVDAAGAEWDDVIINIQTAANLMDDIKTDTGAIKTRVELALPNAAADAAGGLPISDAGGLDLDAQIGTDIDDILADTGTDGVVLKAAGLDADAVDEILDEVIEGSTTFRQAIRIILSALAAKSAGGGTATITFRDIGDGKDRITATVDGSGNRTAVTLDGS